MMTEGTSPQHPQSIDQARDDLAFLQSIMTEKTPALYNAGLLYGAAGILYGLQCLISWIGFQVPGLFPETFLVINGFLPTAIFLIVCVVVARSSKTKGYGKNFTTRAMAGVFGGAGIANLALIAVFALAAFRREDFSIWLFYPVSVCALQGAVWYGAAVIRRRWWMGAVAMGWMLSAVIASLFIENVEMYIAVLGLALFTLMALPGYAFMRISRTQEASA
ncbi:MAG: hypothetical protein AAGA69_08430 [Pseudomonadota bacterium]